MDKILAKKCLNRTTISTYLDLCGQGKSTDFFFYPQTEQIYKHSSSHWNRARDDIKMRQKEQFKKMLEEM